MHVPFKLMRRDFYFNVEYIFRGDDMKFKCRLKVIFAERDIRQKEFAERVGISPAGISALANNKYNPKFEHAYRIAKELGMNIEEIWIEEDER
jgi:putative transcriptional regulator